MTSLPRDTWHQHLYPRLRGYSIGEDHEITVHLSLGLPCCGLDLLVEHPPTLTALELYSIAGEFCELHRKVKQLPSFQVCHVNPPLDSTKDNEAAPPSQVAEALEQRSGGL